MVMKIYAMMGLAAAIAVGNGLGVFPPPYPSRDHIGSQVNERLPIRAAGTVGGVQVLAAGDIADCDIGSSSEWWQLRIEAAFGGNVKSRMTAAGASHTAQIIANHPGAIVLGLGDLAYSAGTKFDFDTCFDKHWGAFRQRTYPTVGNHEYRTWGARGYFSYWGNLAGPSGRGYYGFDLPGWLVLSLNSEIDASEGSQQARWLRDTLSATNAGCVLAFFHRPAYSAGKRSGNENSIHLFRLLHEHGASIVLSGHNHFYERTAPLNADGLPVEQPETARGIRAFTVGTGGAKLKSAKRPADFTRALLNNHWGMLLLNLKPGEYDWEFLTAGPLRNAAAQNVDKGSAKCVDRSSLQ